MSFGLGLDLSFGFMRFTGTPTNYNPVVDITTANNSVFNEGDLITFDASGVDLDGTIVSAIWYIDGVEVEDELDPAALQYQTNSLVAGSYTVSITVTDDDGATTTDSINFVVQAVDDVAGLGTHEVMSDPFIANEVSQATGIRIDGLIFDQDPNGLQAPDSFLVAPVISVAGTNSDGSAIVLEDYQVHWVLTDADDNALSYDDVVIDAKNGGYKDYNQCLGTVGFIPIDMAGDMKLTVKVSVASSTMGMMWSDTYEYEYTTLDHAGDREYYDATDGGDNDGLDPLGHLLFNGSGGGLTNASYTEATGYLSQTGAFEGVTLTTEARPYCSNRWLYLDGSYVELAEIIDNDTARIADNYKLGADATGLTSSGGAKSDTAYEDRRLYNSGDNNHMLFLSGVNSDVYQKTNAAYVRGVTGHTGLVGYGGRATIRSSDTGNAVLDIYASSSSYITCENFYAGNLILDGEDTKSPFVMQNNAEYQTRNRVTLDNIDFINNKAGSAIVSGATGFSDGDGDEKKDIHVYIRGGHLQNKWSNEHTYTIDTATSGAGSFTVNEAIDADVLQHSIIRIVDGSTSHIYFSDTWSGSTFTLKKGRGGNPPENLSQTYTSGATVSTFNPKTISLFGFFTHAAIRGTTFEGDGAETTFDHLVYQSFKKARSALETELHYFCDNLAKAESRRLNYFSNLNNDSHDNLSHFNESENFAEAGSCLGMIEGSGGTNSTANGTFTGVYRYGNKALDCLYPMNPYTITQCGFYENEFATSNPTDRPAINFGEGGTNSSEDAPNDDTTQQELWPDSTWSWKVQRNKIYNYKAMKTKNSNENNNPDLYNKFQQGSLSYVGNEVWYTGAESVVEIGLTKAYADDGVLTFTGNNIYAPSADFEVDDSTMNLATFNSTVGGTNTGTMPAWNDPENGDFSTGTAPQKLTFDPAEPIYIDVSNTNTGDAYFTQGAAYRVELDVKLVSSASAQYFIAGASSGGYDSSHAFAGMSLSNVSTMENTSYLEIDDVDIPTSTDISAYVDDDTLHTIDIKIIASKRVGAIGIAHGGAAGFAGELYEVRIINDSDDAEIATFVIDEVKLDGETMTHNGIVLTFRNTDAGDWSAR